MNESINSQNLGDNRNDTLFKTIDNIEFKELKVKEDTIFKVELYIRNVCDSTVNKLLNYRLAGNYKSFVAEGGICYVDQKGQYKIEDYGINYFDVYQINIQSTYQIDTLTQYKIYVARGPGIPGWPYYSFCGKRCDGQLTDYYENGNIRIIGKFINGNIKNIRLYDKSGQLSQVIKNSKLRSLNEVYENGKLIIKLKRVLIFGSAKVWDVKFKKYYNGEYYQFKN